MNSSESEDVYVSLSTIARLTSSHYRQVKRWAADGTIRVQQMAGMKPKYSLADARRLVASSRAGS